jgi:hypothetical protein
MHIIELWVIGLRIVMINGCRWNWNVLMVMELLIKMNVVWLKEKCLGIHMWWYVYSVDALVLWELGSW